MSKITEKYLIKRITLLKGVKPDKNWVVFCREQLIQELKREQEALSQSERTKMPKMSLAAFLKEILAPRAALKPAGVLIVIFGLIFSSSILVMASAKNSLPGDRLFPVKIAIEEAQLLVAPSVEYKADFQNQIVDRRLEELDRIIGQNGPSEIKNTKIEEAVANLQKQLLTIKDDLPQLSKVDNKKAAEIARKIDAQATEVRQKLAETKSSLSTSGSASLSEKISEASEIADKTGNKAFEVIVQAKPDAGISEEEILAMLEQKIQKTAEKIKMLEGSVPKTEFSINATIILDESDKALEKAKASLEQKDVNAAFETVKVANEMIKSIEKLVQDASVQSDTETKPSESENESRVTATSTPSSAIPASTSTSASLQ